MKTILELDIPFHQYQMGRIDELIDELLRNYGLDKGVVIIKTPPEVLLVMIEYEEFLVQDFRDIYMRYDQEYKNNLNSHIKGVLPRNEMIIPFNMNTLVIGDWQQVTVFALAELPSISIDLEFIQSDEILGLENVRTELEFQTFDITTKVEKTLGNTDGEKVTIITPDSTVGLYVLNPEYYGLLNEFLIEIASSHREYRHRHDFENDEVAHVHIRAAFVGQTVTIPTKKGVLDLPNNSRLFLTELSSHPMRRDLYFELWK